MKQRLSKVMAAAGIASRRKCEDLIFSGKVCVNSKQILEPQFMVDPKIDTITVNKQCVQSPEQKVYFAVHKPLGYICTNDSRVRRRAVDLVNCPNTHLFTVGRLDKETSGLILITNDGQFAHQVTHPSKKVAKEYIAKVDQEITHAHLVSLTKGCYVTGVYIKPVSVKKVRKSTVRIVVKEGRYHEVRELLATSCLQVLELKRVRIGNLCLGSIPVGGYKQLSQKKVHALFSE